MWLCRNRERGWGWFFQGFRGVFITGHDAGCLREVPASWLGPRRAAATRAVGAKHVLGKSWDDGLGFWKFRNSRARTVWRGWRRVAWSSLFHPIPTPVSAFVARCSPNPGKVQILLFFPDPSLPAVG